MTRTAERDYGWQRFWRPRGGRVRISEQGYSRGPGAYSPDIFTFEQIVDVPCLALLGEPGIGKSRTLRREFDALRAALHPTSDRAILLDLRSYGSEHRLVQALFEGVGFVKWVCGGGRIDVRRMMDEANHNERPKHSRVRQAATVFGPAVVTSRKSESSPER